MEGDLTRPGDEVDYRRSSGIDKDIVLQRSDWLWLTLILLVATILRGIGLESSLWYDEIVTLVDFVRLPTMEVVRTFSSFNNHILYSLAAQASIGVFGESAWALRLPAVVFGVASVAAMWWLARQLVSRWEANVTALLLAVSYHHIWFSQNARGYTGLMLWAVVGTALFLRGISQPSWGTWIAYACVLALAAYTHLSAGFFFATHGLVYLVIAVRTAYYRRDGVQTRNAGSRELSLFKPFVGFALGGALVLLLYAPLIPQVFHAAESVSVPAAGGGAVTEWKNPVWTVLEVLRNLQGLGIIAGIGLPVVLIFSALGAFSLIRRHPAFAAIFLTYIPLTLLCVWALSFRIWPRYFFSGLGFIFLCLTHGVFVAGGYFAKSFSTFRRWRLSGQSLGMAGSLIGVLCSLFLLPVNYRYPKQDFLGARNFVESARAPKDRVASIGLASFPFSRYYAPNWDVVGSWKEIEDIRISSAHTWIVYAYSGAMMEHHSDVLAHLASEFELMKRFPGTLGDGAVFVYRSNADNSLFSKQE